MAHNPFSLNEYSTKQLHTSRDALLFATENAVLHAQVTLMDITDAEYNWEPIPLAEREHDQQQSPETKRVWRVFPSDEHYSYDYGERPSTHPAFTTIAWIMTYVAVTADMYLYCVRTGKAVGEDITWDDLPIYGTLSETRDYVFRALKDTQDFLSTLPSDEMLNKLTPAPWGEMRPTFINLWGGVIEHSIQHMMQIAVRKEQIRHTF